jgi:hypothetical protein
MKLWAKVGLIGIIMTMIALMVYTVYDELHLEQMRRDRDRRLTEMLLREEMLEDRMPVFPLPPKVKPRQKRGTIPYGAI